MPRSVKKTQFRRSTQIRHQSLWHEVFVEYIYFLCLMTTIQKLHSTFTFRIVQILFSRRDRSDVFNFIRFVDFVLCFRWYFNSVVNGCFHFVQEVFQKDHTVLICVWKCFLEVLSVRKGDSQLNMYKTHHFYMYTRTPEHQRKRLMLPHIMMYDKTRQK